MVEHPLCCDCDRCLNGSGGYTLPGQGATVPTPGDKRPNRVQPLAHLSPRRAELLEREDRARRELWSVQSALGRLDAQEASRV